MPCNYHSTVTVVRNWVCVHMCEQESQGERNRKEGRASRKMAREREREREREGESLSMHNYLTSLVFLVGLLQFVPPEERSRAPSLLPSPVISVRCD